MRLARLLSIIEYTSVNDIKNPELDTEILSLAADTKKMKPGCAFFCIRGFRFDPHGCLKEIVQKGAAVIIVERRDIDLSGVPVPVICVNSSRTALSAAAVVFYGRPDWTMRLIGVTGTNGKTSVTYFIESLLKEAGKRAGVIGTVGVKAQGRDLGINFAASTTPDTLELMEILSAFMTENTDSVVMEVSSHAMALHKVDALNFRVGVFTNLTQDHLDFHGDMDSYFSAKAALFNQCEYGIINADDPWGQSLIKTCECKTLTYGTEADCDLRAVNIAHTASGVSYELEYLGCLAKCKVVIPIPGLFTVYNSLAAIGAGFALNISPDVIISGLSKMKSVPGRVQSIPNDLNISVIVDYAHTPDGLGAIIKSMKPFSKKIITVFGCGGDRDKSKRSVMGRVAGTLSDYCVITSDNPRSEEPADIIRDAEQGMKQTPCGYETLEDRKDAIKRALSLAEEGDCVIIAGKGHEDYQELKSGTVHFNDAETAAEILRSAKV